MKNARIIAFLSLLFGVTLYHCRPAAPQQEPAAPEQELTVKQRLSLRADSFELNTPYEPVPGDSLSHHAAGFAKVLCSAVFITGLDFDFAAENIGYFSAPYAVRSKFAKRTLDKANQSVQITLPNGTIRTAKYFGDQGCICLAEGEENLHFKPQKVKSNLPPANTQDWPMGDRDAAAVEMPGVDQALIKQALDTVFSGPDNLTAAFMVVHKGKIIAERYREGIDQHTKLENWSMGKSLTATLLGVLMQQGVYTLHQPAPIPEWQQTPDDPRAKITIANILNMSSGLRFRAPQDPDYDPSLGYPDHLYVYTGGINSFQWAATRPQQWLPNTVGRYRNSDPVLINYLVRLGVEGRGQNYWNFPQQDLFDKIGVRNMVMETDPYGNFLLQGYEFGTARDWARLGLLYLNGGEWMGERIIPADFVQFVKSLAPSWKADGRLIYGGFFWLNGDNRWKLPTETYYMAGAGGQFAFIVPSLDLVIINFTHYKGGAIQEDILNAALGKVTAAIK